MVGPSSLMLALMASGLNGQSFTFCGYLPAKPDERKARLRAIEKLSASSQQTQIFILRAIEKLSASSQQTQIFIETPYRNDSMLKDILQCCRDTTRVCVAADMTTPQAYIRTLTVGQWKKEDTVIGKRPCVFLLLA